MKGNIECMYDAKAEFPTPVIVKSDIQNFEAGMKLDIGKLVLLMKKGASIIILPKG